MPISSQLPTTNRISLAMMLSCLKERIGDMIISLARLHKFPRKLGVEVILTNTRMKFHEFHIIQLRLRGYLHKVQWLSPVIISLSTKRRYQSPNKRSHHNSCQRADTKNTQISRRHPRDQFMEEVQKICVLL